MSTHIVPDWPAPQRVRALSSTRLGGCSEGRYASLNLGAHVGDRPQAVTGNRRRLVAEAALPDEPVWLEQVHGTAVIRLTGALQSQPVADAAWTTQPGIVCCVMTADCLPILLCDAAGTRVGVAHAGWRGLAAGVIEATAAAMGGADLLAWLGPAISQAAYEVGEDVRTACIERDADAGQAFAANARGRWQADLGALARRRLARAGVGRVFGGEHCTYTDAERFFSHRREAPCGRMATLIWLEEAG